MKKFCTFGIEEPEILLPAKKDLSTWCVIACDQYTQDKEYWKNVEDAAGTNPSTLNLILPEVYLSSPDRKQRIEKINSTMKKYLSDGVFDKPESEFIYVERTTSYGRVRHGLIAAIDLDAYEWKPFSKALIRATEATIVERIPPRKEIRKGAPLESPHIMLLVNDVEHLLVEKTGERVKKNSPVYEGKLMLESGSIKGWAVKDQADKDAVLESLEILEKKNTQKDGSIFMFAVGDGNHSLATAKAVWDEYREEQRKLGVSEEKINQSPVRYALVEIVNIYDSGLTFEPIHRVLFNVKVDSLVSAIQKCLGGKVKMCSSSEEMENTVRNSKASFGFTWTENNEQKFKVLETPVTELAVSRLQPVIDDFIKTENASGTKIEIDYIHGSDEVIRLGKEKNAVAVMLPPVAKDSFFTTISGSGPLPRKSFSMGEASEKRFYLECRKLFDC